MVSRRQPELVEFIRLEQHIVAVVEFIALHDVGLRHDFAGFSRHLLIADALLRFAIDLMQRDLVFGGGGAQDAGSEW